MAVIKEAQIIPPTGIKPKSVIRIHPYFVLLSGRLFSAFVEDVAGYIEKKRGNKMTATVRNTDE